MSFWRKTTMGKIKEEGTVEMLSSWPFGIGRDDRDKYT